MSSTNKTTNYELSQFIGSDKPAWLSDYNGDMGKIDAGIHSAQTTATGADGKADANTTKIGTLASLTTTAKTDLVSAINEVDANADTAQNTATQAGTLATSAKTVADGLQAYITLTQYGDITPTVSAGTIYSAGTGMFYALNTAGTYGKIYGRLRYTTTSSGNVTVTLPINKLDVATAFTISCGAWYTVAGGGGYQVMNALDITVNTNGTATITVPGQTVGYVVTLWLPPCIYYFSDFGDTPTPE